MSTNPQNRKSRPETPEKFIEMIRDHHLETRAKRFMHGTKHEECANPCNKRIAAVGTPGKRGYRERVPLRLDGHHALRLCEEIKRSTEAGSRGFSLEQQEAREAFTALIEDTSSDALMKRLGWGDARQVSEDEMKKLIKILSGVFFPTTRSDAQMELKFKWKDWRYTPHLIGTYQTREDGTPMISMCAFHIKGEPDYGRLNGIAMGRLATVLHELVHAYLDHYACRCVPYPASFEEDVDQLGGHGRAWQRIASSIERAAPNLISLPLSLGGFKAIKFNWGALVYWPTQKEANDWQLKG